MIKDYLKVCKNNDEYINFKFSEDFILPNVTLVEDEKKLEFNDDLFNGHEYIDLGLPSGTLWSTKNVGSESGSDYGLFFAWGETEGYKKDDGHIFSEEYYTVKDKYQIGDENLRYIDDAAYIHMGGNWHMPTKEQIDELINNCNIAVLEKETKVSIDSGDTSNKIQYYQITSNKNNKIMYMPLACSINNSTFELGTDCIWSNENFNQNNSYVLMVNTERLSNGELDTKITFGTNETDTYRYKGIQVRGVIDNVINKK